MIAEAIEFQISQYVDGTLNAAERQALEAILHSDAQAFKVLADYQRIDAQLTARNALPAINWGRLADQVSASIDRATDAPAVAGRIGFWSPMKMRIAAAVLVTATSAIVARHYLRATAPIVKPAPAQTDVIVSGPMAEAAGGPAVTDISIAPSRTAQLNDPGRFAGVVGRPGKVEIYGLAPPPKRDSH